MIKDYYLLTKPGVVAGNAIVATAGFFLASLGAINLSLLGATLVGLSFLMAGALAFNSYIDRDIDVLMERTKNRPLAQKRISETGAVFFASLLGVIGALVLSFYTNLVAVGVSLVGFFAYVVVYSLWAKRKSFYGTEWGSISGAIPPAVGYCAVSGSIDLIAIMLFGILSVWQITHAYAIAIYRIEDYGAAKIPIVSLKRGIPLSKRHIFGCILIFTVFAALLSLPGHLTGFYMAGMLILGLGWAMWGAAALGRYDDKNWAHRMFLLSVFVLMAFCILVIIDRLIFI